MFKIGLEDARPAWTCQLEGEPCLQEKNMLGLSVGKVGEDLEVCNLNYLSVAPFPVVSGICLAPSPSGPDH